MRTSLKTVRLRAEESRWVDQFLKQNSWIESFSEMARLAILDFIQRDSTIPIQPITTRSSPRENPKFLWDYNLDVTQVKTILGTEPLAKKAWLIARILEEAPFGEVWEYLSIEDIREALPKLRMSEKRKKHWEYAIHEWTGR